MTKKLLVLVALLSFSFGAQAQTIETLQSKISEILETKDATVGVAVFAGHSDESISINGNKRLPMQSVFKYHIAVAILDQVDKGNLSLSDKLEVTKKDLDNELVRLKEKEEELKVDVNKLHDPNYVSRYAREKYYFTNKEGEYVFKLPEN